MDSNVLAQNSYYFLLFKKILAKGSNYKFASSLLFCDTYCSKLTDNCLCDWHNKCVNCCGDWVNSCENCACIVSIAGNFPCSITCFLLKNSLSTFPPINSSFGKLFIILSRTFKLFSELKHVVVELLNMTWKFSYFVPSRTFALILLGKTFTCMFSFANSYLRSFHSVFFRLPYWKNRK